MSDADIPPVVQAQFLSDGASASATGVLLGPSFGVSCHLPRSSFTQLPPDGSKIVAAQAPLPTLTPEPASARAEGSRVLSERPISREQMLSSGSLVLVDEAAEAYWATDAMSSAKLHTAPPEPVPVPESEPLQTSALTRPTLRTHYTVPSARYAFCPPVEQEEDRTRAPPCFPVEDRARAPVPTSNLGTVTAVAPPVNFGTVTAVAPPVYVGTVMAAPDSRPVDGFPSSVYSAQLPSMGIPAAYPAMPTSHAPSPPLAEPVLGSVAGPLTATDSPGTVAAWNKHMEVVNKLFAESAPPGSAVTPGEVHPLGSVAVPLGSVAAPCGVQPLGSAAAPLGSVAWAGGVQPLGCVAAPSMVLPGGCAAPPAAPWQPGGLQPLGTVAGVQPLPAMYPVGTGGISVLPSVPNAVRAFATRSQGDAPQASFHL